MAFRDIRKSRKWLSAEEIRIIVALIIVLAVLLALNIFLARTLPGGEWLYQRWGGARAFLGIGNVSAPADMYGTAIAQDVQQIVYGRNAFADEYRYVLNDPFYIVLFYVPFVILPNIVNGIFGADFGFELVRGLWMLLSEIALVLIVLFSFRLSELEPPRWLFVVLMGFGLFSLFSLLAWITASPTIFLTFLYLSILLALRSFSDELAGALLFLTAYQWEVSALFYLFILIFVFANRRWGVLAGFGMSLLILLIVSLLTYPGWGLPYIRAVISTLLQGSRINVGSILAEWLPAIRFSLGGVVAVMAVGIVVIESIGAVQAPFRRIMWVACLALAATPLAGLAVFPSNFVALLPSLILVVALVWERWLRRRFLAAALIIIVALVVPFALYLQTVFVYAPLYTQILSVLPPVTTIAALYWMRWWVVHSPRTWADQIGYRK
jgi:hypothetical protein